jgi:pyruvate dehydrogenase E1 component beta subunit
MSEITLVEAVTQALAYELSSDPSVVVFGEDVGLNGGVFRATNGLQQKFGEYRVFDTPLAESMIVGLSIGMATQNIKPICEIQFMGFIYSAVDQIVCHAARLRNRTRGRLTCPLVIRAPFGGGIHAPEHHSESTESIFSHIPGLRVVMPSSPQRAYGLLLAAIRDPDPVIFLEPKRIYRKVKQNVPDNGEALPLDTCFILQEGTDITLVTWGAMVHETMLVAKKLQEDNISAEVIDLATIKPIDIKTILNSVEKTGKCVIIQEAAKTCSVSSEIAAQLAEHALTSLFAPVKRITGYDTAMPYYKLENQYMLSVDKIYAGIQEVLNYA